MDRDRAIGGNARICVSEQRFPNHIIPHTCERPRAVHLTQALLDSPAQQMCGERAVAPGCPISRVRAVAIAGSLARLAVRDRPSLRRNLPPWDLGSVDQ